MLRQLDSRQLAEMYAYYRVENNPLTEEDKARKRAQELQSMFSRASQANEQRAAQLSRK